MLTTAFLSAYCLAQGGSSVALLQPNAAITNIVEFNTEMGIIRLGLYGKDAPKTTANMLGLIGMKFYDGIAFHRVVPGFVVQAGDPFSKDTALRDRWGTGGESYYGPEFPDELNPETPSWKTGYVRGVLAMANKGKNTNSSQFFICVADLTLDKNYTIFGRVLEGMDIVDAIVADGYSTQKNTEPVRIVSARTIQ